MKDSISKEDVRDVDIKISYPRKLTKTHRTPFYYLEVLIDGKSLGAFEDFSIEFSSRSAYPWVSITRCIEKGNGSETVRDAFYANVLIETSTRKDRGS